MSTRNTPGGPQMGDMVSEHVLDDMLERLPSLCASEQEAYKRLLDSTYGDDPFIMRKCIEEYMQISGERITLEDTLGSARMEKRAKEKRKAGFTRRY